MGAFDVLVIGAPASHGQWSSADATTRGLSTAMGRKARDFASGTSSRSSKLFHGVCAIWRNWILPWFGRRQRTRTDVDKTVPPSRYRQSPSLPV